MNAPFRWTVSKLSAFETCPRQHEKIDIKKLFPRGENAAGDFGNELHKALEKYTRSNGTELIEPKFKDYQSYADKVLALPGRKSYEVELALDEKLDACPYFGNEAWYRCKIDVMVQPTPELAIIIDYKSGKLKDDVSQIDLNALALFAHYPKIERVGSAYWWLSNGGVITKTKLHRRDVPGTWKKYLPRVQRYQDAIEQDDFPPKPSGLCRGWCGVSTCEYWKEKRHA